MFHLQDAARQLPGRFGQGFTTVSQGVTVMTEKSLPPIFAAFVVLGCLATNALADFIELVDDLPGFFMFTEDR